MQSVVQRTMETNLLTVCAVSVRSVLDCSLKVRVMPSCWFVLLRYWLRVDGVIIRLRDTRCFHAFGSSVVIREHSYKEAPCPKPEPIPFPPSKSAELVVALDYCCLIAAA